MSMLLAQGAMGGLSAASLSAPLDDINTTLGAPQTNANRTITYAGANRTFRANHALAGTLDYRVNSGTYTSCTNGTTFVVPSGQTLNFRFNATTGGDNNVPVTVNDQTRGTPLDVFTCNDFVP